MESRISVQVSLYPLRRARIGATIAAFGAALEDCGLEVHPGSMSTVIQGECGAVFRALEHAFAAVAADGDVVLCTTFSNACPG